MGRDEFFLYGKIQREFDYLTSSNVIPNERSEFWMHLNKFPPLLSFEWEVVICWQEVVFCMKPSRQKVEQCEGKVEQRIKVKVNSKDLFFQIFWYAHVVWHHNLVNGCSSKSHKCHNSTQIYFIRIAHLCCFHLAELYCKSRSSRTKWSWKDHWRSKVRFWIFWSSCWIKIIRKWKTTT